MKCKNQNCKTAIVFRKELRENNGFCDTCAEIRESNRKVSNDLLTSFSGKGSRGFVQWLKMGKFLQVINDGAEVSWYNDRVAVIMAMAGGKLDRLLNEFAKAALTIAKEETEADD